MRILITGGAGYIGSVLVGKLLEAGYHVTVLDNFMYGQATALAGYCHDPHFNVVCGDVRHSDDLQAAGIKHADIIIPLAAIVGAPACDRDPEVASSTIQGALYTMARHIESTQQQIIYTTTNSGYGVGEPGKFCTEETPLRPISLYGKLKVVAEMHIMQHRNAISLRLATVFGMSPRMRLDLLVNDFVWRAVHDRFVVLFEPHFKRNYIHVRDVANAILFCIENSDRMCGQVYNVGLSDANLSKLELCRAIQKRLPDFTFVEAPVGSDPDKRDYVVSNTKIEATGWRPEFSLDGGIVELIKGYRMFRRTEFANA